jgi:hypothetical protein
MEADESYLNLINGMFDLVEFQSVPKTATKEEAASISTSNVSRLNNFMGAFIKPLDDTELSEYPLYFDFVYGTTNLHEFASQAYHVGGMSYTYKDQSIFGYEGLLHQAKLSYVPIIQSDNLFKGLYKAAIDLIRKFVEAIVGKNYANILYKDVLYASSLANYNKFIATKGLGKNLTWEPLKETEKLLKCR